MPEASLGAVETGSLFEQLLAGPVGVGGDRLLGELLSKPLASAVLTGVSLIPQLNPYLRVGAVISGIIIQNMGQPLFLTGKSGGPIPANWATSNSPPLTQDGTIVDQFKKGLYSGKTSFYNNPAAACSSYSNNLGTFSSGGKSPYSDNYICTYSDGDPRSNGESSFYPSQSATCPEGYSDNSGMCTKANCPKGYTFSSGSCFLSEDSTNKVPWPTKSTPVAVSPNSSNTGWEQAPRDSNSPAPEKIPSTPSITQNSISPTTSQPQQDTVASTPSGGLSIKHMEQFTDPGGSTAVKTSTITTDQSGTVTETTNVITPNITLHDLASSIPTVSNIDTSNLARDSSLQATNAKLDQLHSDLSGGGGSFPPIPDECGIADCWNLVFNAIRAKFTMPTFSDSGASCPVWSYTFSYPAPWSLTINEHCAWDSTIRPLIQSVMILAYSIIGIKIVMSA